MPSTENWIQWSIGVAQPYRHINYQLYLEVAQAACRYSRDSRGLSTVPELANADHYWLARYFVFLSAGAGRDAVQPSANATAEQRLNVAATQDFISLFPSAITGYAIVPILSVAWDVWKRIDPRDPPTGSPPASAPSAAQISWALEGCRHGFERDRLHADQMIWGFAMNRFLVGRITIPPPPV